MDPSSLYNETSQVSDPAAIPPVEERVKQVVLSAMKFGQELTAEFGAMNILSGKSTADVAALASALAPLQALLLSGSLHTAKEWMASPAAASVPQATRDYFISRINSYLA